MVAGILLAILCIIIAGTASPPAKNTKAAPEIDAYKKLEEALEKTNTFDATHLKIQTNTNATCMAVFGNERHIQHGCVALVIKLHGEAKEEELLKALEFVDGHDIVERITVRVSSHLSIVDTGKTIDKFLTSRLRWIVLSDDRFANKNPESNGKHFDHESHARTHIYLHRTGNLWKGFLEKTAGLQYPPAEACKETPLILGHMVNSGWGSHLSMFEMVMQDAPWAIFNIWDSNTNEKSESVFYASPKTCPDEYNKRLCAFLPMTNCSMPTYMTEAKGQDYRARWPGDIISYTSATTSGDVFNMGPGVGKKPHGAYQKQLEATYKAWKPHNAGLSIGLSTFLNGNGLVVDDSRKNPNLVRVLLIFGLMFRFNSLYRNLVQERIYEFRKSQSPPFSSDMDCVTIHIRRGDRAKGITDMNEFCRSIRRIEGDKCERDGKEISCGSVSDLGCFSLHPFGGVSLQDYLDRASKLRNVKTAFVLTDDGPWLEEQKKNHIEPGWNIYTIPARGDSRKHDSPHATENGVDFFASMALARQCSAFVGHWGSGVTHVTFHNMCYQHAGHIGMCPPACDIGNK